MVCFVEEEEFGPLDSVEQSVARVSRRPEQCIFVHPLQFVPDNGAARVDAGHQMRERSLLVAGEVRVGVRHIGIESGRCFHLDPFKSDQKDPLITGQVGNIVEGAPFARVDVSPELLFGQVTCEFINGLMLVLEADKR